MKRIISLILAVTMLLGVPLALTSCDGGSCEYKETRSIEGRDISASEVKLKLT